MLTSSDLQKIKNKHFCHNLAEEDNVILECVFYLDESPSRVMFNVVNNEALVSKNFT